LTDDDTARDPTKRAVAIAAQFIWAKSRRGTADSDRGMCGVRRRPSGPRHAGSLGGRRR